MVQHYARIASSFGHAATKVAARAMGAENLATRYSSLGRRDAMPAEEMDPEMQKRFQAMMESIPAWGVATLIATAILGMVMIASIRYTLHGVVGTLAMVESPQTTVLVREEKADKYSDKANALVEDIVDQDIIILKQKPMTSSIRATIHHLQSRGGFLARWRGLPVLVASGLTFAFLKNLITSLFGPMVLHREFADVSAAPIIASVLARLLVARLGLTWTHVVISEPSAKSWIRRIPGRNAWRQILAPTFYTACAWQLTFTLPKILAKAMDLDNAQALHEENAHCTAMKLLSLGLITLISFVGICIPAEVALRRVQASMLPEADNSIVPFDRTFGGMVQSEAVGGKGKLGYVEAWKTFDRSARLGLLKLYAKFFLVEVVLHAVFATALVTEFVVLTGLKADDFKIQPI